jgi:hypothetical protein
MQEDHEFEISLGYKVRSSCLKNQTKTERERERVNKSRLYLPKA